MDLIIHLLATFAFLGAGALFVSLPWAVVLGTSAASDWCRAHISHRELEEDFGW